VELRELEQLLKQNINKILLITFMGGLVGVIAYFVIPIKYLASGSFYISRHVDDNGEKYFEYEGYYGQQTAQAYTSNFIGMLDSIDVKSTALNTLAIKPTEESLRKISRDTKVKKVSPQIISLVVTGNSSEEAKLKWNSIANAALAQANELNQKGDASIVISKLNNFPDPITKTEFRKIYVNALIGIGLGFIAALIIFTYKRYYEHE